MLPSPTPHYPFGFSFYLLAEWRKEEFKIPSQLDFLNIYLMLTGRILKLIENKNINK